MAAESLKKIGGTKKIVIIANFATDRVNGAYNVIENIAAYTNKLGYNCELWGLSTELDQNNYPFYVHFAANLLKFTVPEDLKNKLIADQDTILCVNLHSVFTPINIGLSKLVKELNLTLCVTPQGGYHDYTFDRNYLKKKIFLLLYEKAYLKRMDYFFIHGQQEENFIKQYSSKPCYTLLNGFPEGKIKNSIYDYENTRADHKLKLLFMGRLDPLHKGLDLLIKSMSILKDLNIELTLIGPLFTGEGQNYLFDLIKSLNLTKSVIIKAAVYKREEKEALYASHQVFVHTSRWEGMPTGVIEALSYGIPVLVSNGTNLGDIVKKEQLGWVVDELTPTGIATTINSIYKNKDRLNEFSENAHTKAPIIFDWNKIAQQYVEYVSLNA